MSGRRTHGAPMNEPSFDVAAYLARIGFDAPAGAPLAATFDVLAALVARHAQVLPFENIEVLAGGVPGLDMASLQRKLVQGGRGGYCFEHNSLLMACLAHIGFTVRAREARVRSGVPVGVTTARTHMALQVTFDGGEYLVDVGFGGLAPLAPLHLHSSAAQPAGSGLYRFAELPEGELMLQTLLHEGWSDCYELGPGESRPIDFIMGNWFVATHPGGLLRSNLLLGRAQAGGGRLTLFNDKLTLRQPQTAAPEERSLRTRAEAVDVLADGFGLQLEAAELDAVMSVIERNAGAPAAA